MVRTSESAAWLQPAIANAPATPTAATVWQSAAGPGTATGFDAAWRGASAAPAAPQALEREVRQLIEQGWPDQGDTDLSPEGKWRRAALRGPAADEAAAATPAASLNKVQQAFLSRIAPWAEAAGERLGVAPDLVAAHAALESGWGQRPLRDGSGQDTHNLFGLKAAAGYRGAQTEALTTEYEGGNASHKTEVFRRYPGDADAFQDYTRLLQDNPRYRAALQTGSDARAFAQGLARGGYATDPAYAAKLTRLAQQIQSRD